MKHLLSPRASQAFQEPERRLEAQLLFACARTQVTGEQAERILHLAQGDIDWESVLCLARRNGVIPLLSRNLRAYASATAPQPVLEQLEQECGDTARDNLLTTAKLLQILELLTAHHIPAMPFKGPVLASAVYGDLGLRQFMDIDVLVQKSDALRAMDLLEASAFRPDLPLTKPQQGAYLAYGTARHYMRADGLNLDLHWSLTHRSVFALDDELLWQRAESISLLDRKIEIVGWEDLLLFLCIHGSKHRWSSLHLVCDVGETVRARTDIRWDRVVERARRLGGARSLFLGLYLSRILLDVPIPSDVWQRAIEDRRVATLARDTEAELSSERKSSEELSEWVQPFDLKVRERLRDRARFVLHNTFVPSPEEWSFVVLPSRLSLLYYVIRPVRLTVKYTAKVWMRLRENR